jgi:hypothetical protein
MSMSISWDGHRSPHHFGPPARSPPLAMASVDPPEPLIAPPSVDVGQPDAQGELLITQPAGGGLTRADQGRAAAAPLQRSHDLQVIQLRDAGKLPADPGHVGRLTQQVPITHGTVLQPGHQQHATPWCWRARRSANNDRCPRASPAREAQQQRPAGAAASPPRVQPSQLVRRSTGLHRAQAASG